MNELNKHYGFEQTILPHWKAAYNFARWLTRNDDDAADIVQDSYLKAFNAFGGYRGGDSKSWLLSIIKNTFYTKYQIKKRYNRIFDSEYNDDETVTDNANPEILYI